MAECFFRPRFCWPPRVDRGAVMFRARVAGGRAVALVVARQAILAATTLLALTMPSGPARAAASAWDSHSHGAARLVTATEATGSGSRLDIGLQLRLTPGWHTYWRQPGDAGIAPTVDWKGSENLAGAVIAWPAPQRLPPLAGLETVGYMDGVTLPIAATLAHPGGAPAPARRGRLRLLQGGLHPLSCQPRPGPARQPCPTRAGGSAGCCRRNPGARRHGRGAAQAGRRGGRPGPERGHSLGAAGQFRRAAARTRPVRGGDRERLGRPTRSRACRRRPLGDAAHADSGCAGHSAGGQEPASDRG